MNEENRITINNFIVNNNKQSINLKNIIDIEYHIDQHNGLTEFNTEKRSIRMQMTFSEFQLVQEEFDKINS